MARKSSVTVCVRLVLVNAKAARGLAEAEEILLDLAADQPWQEQLKDALKRLKYARRHLDYTEVSPDDDPG